MQCVILAAGRGVRMGALTEQTPKPMLPIRGIPKLEYTLRALPVEVTEVVFIIGYLGEKIREHFGKSFDGRRITYVEQEKLNGSGGAMHLVKDVVRGKFLVIMGDDLYRREDLEKLMQHDLAVLACEVEDSNPFGVLETDVDGKLLSIIERPHDGTVKLVNTGAYMLHENFFQYPLVSISETEYGLPQTLVSMRDQYTIAVEQTKTWFPIGTPEALAEAERVIEKFV
ncbi:MAG: sugar phosphate nucleotidyltransferase [Candidatus Moraniibacteriota bacterium]